MNVILYNDKILQNWNKQIYPPQKYVFLPPQSKKIYKKVVPLTETPESKTNIHRFDFDIASEKGWPCFKNRKEHVKNEKWSLYYRMVYRGLPRKQDYPICVSQLSRIYVSITNLLNITLPDTHYDKCEKESLTNIRSWSRSKEPYWLYYFLHYKPPRKPISSNTWIEVTHRSRSWISGYERQGMWFEISGGTGVWLNTGKTIAFNEHHDGFNYFNSDWETDMAYRAKELGYDTIQFIYGDSQNHPCCNKLGLKPGCFGLEIVSTKMVGNYACGGANSSFRAGWMAQYKCKCTEDNIGRTNSKVELYAGYINCFKTASKCNTFGDMCETHIPIRKVTNKKY